jgi:DoxX-like protein
MAFTPGYVCTVIKNIKQKIMLKNKNHQLKKIPAVIVAIFLSVSGSLKILGIHPMLQHFNEMGFNSTMIKLLGLCEITFSLLFLFSRSSKIGVLLLTAYFGGAMAAEIPYHQAAAPFVPLMLVWLTAFIRQRSLFLQNPNSNILSNFQRTNE